MTILIMLILISLLIIVHELGHFIAARLCGVQVSKFALGLPFGPTLFRKKIGGTEFLIHAFLLGGYISFPDDEKNENDENILSEDSPLRFKNKKPWQKAFIVSAGIIANILFAIFAVILAAAIYGKLPSGNADVYIQEIIKKENSSNIEQMGAKAGDKFLSVNGIKINSSYRLIFMIQKSKYFDGYVSRDDVDAKIMQLEKLNPELQNKDALEAGKTIKLPPMTPEKSLDVPEHVASGYEKYENGELELNSKEKELRNEIEGKTAYSPKESISKQELAKALADSYKPLNIEVERDGKSIMIQNVHTDKEGLLGIRLESKEIFIETKTPVEIVSRSFTYLWDSTKNMIFGLLQLFTGKIPINELHGIVAITKIGGDIIENHGMLNGILLTAIISVNLAIINLLPIPALDGGHLLFIILEKITGRKLNEEILDKIANTCFLLLILLMVFVVFNDIFALVTNKFG